MSFTLQTLNALGVIMWVFDDILTFEELCSLSSFNLLASVALLSESSGPRTRTFVGQASLLNGWGVTDLSGPSQLFHGSLGAAMSRIVTALMVRTLSKHSGRPLLRGLRNCRHTKPKGRGVVRDFFRKVNPNPTAPRG
ncbi:hypothetical protein BD779DRAFT_426576 [Infundibulicybe gibba]|nr:hypothetical protein BD779DRAFT_426576 [Infundibulicybe gibba]